MLRLVQGLLLVGLCHLTQYFSQDSLSPYALHVASIGIKNAPQSMSKLLKSYFRSLKKFPSQTQRLFHTYLPFPYFLSRWNSPTYNSQLSTPDCHLPKPSRKPQWKCPKQNEPLNHMYFPYPQNLPFSQVPIYRSPFLNTSIPKPILTSFQKIPQQILPQNSQCPFPSFFPFPHKPQQQILSANQRYFPYPFLYPLTHSPQQRYPKLTNEPFPFLLLSLKVPQQQLFPFENYFPKPVFSFFLSSHPPIQSLPLKYHTTLVKGNLLSSKMILFLNFFKMQSYKSFEEYQRFVYGSTFKISSIISYVEVEQSGLLGIQGMEVILKSLFAFLKTIFQPYRIRLILFKSIT